MTATFRRRLRAGRTPAIESAGLAAAAFPAEKSYHFHVFTCELVECFCGWVLQCFEACVLLWSGVAVLPGFGGVRFLCWRCWRGAVLDGSDVREFYCSRIRVFRGFSVCVLARKQGKDVTLDNVADSCLSVKAAKGRR